jgi:hypothetical protein
MIHITKTEKSNLIPATIYGKITKEDAEKINPLIHNIVKNGDNMDFFFELVNFKGYNLKGLWEDLKVDAAHISNYGKMAFVGAKEWQQWAVGATNFFTARKLNISTLPKRKRLTDGF